MPVRLARRPLLRLRRRNDPFLRAKHAGDLDIVMTPPYDMSDAWQSAAREKVTKLIQQLHGGALDGNSREVLNNLINAWTDQEIARLRSHRDERKAVGRTLIGLAREEVSRHKHRYEADYVRAQHARHALALAYQELTGAELPDLPSPHPRHVPDGPVQPPLGPVTLTDEELASYRAVPDADGLPPGMSREYQPGTDEGIAPSVNGSAEHVPTDTESPSEEP